jgi:hypothetical protein
MYGPAARCKRLCWTLADAVLRQCIRFPFGACAPAIMDISAHAILLADRPHRAVGVTRVRTRREDRSSIVVSSSRKTRRVRLVITSSIASRLCAVPSFVPGSRSFVPTCACRRAARKVRQGWPSRWPCRLLPCCQAALDGAEHGARITLDGMPSHRSCRTQRRAPC